MTMRDNANKLVYRRQERQMKNLFITIIALSVIFRFADMILFTTAKMTGAHQLFQGISSIVMAVIMTAIFSRLYYLMNRHNKSEFEIHWLSMILLFVLLMFMLANNAAFFLIQKVNNDEKNSILKMAKDEVPKEQLT